ncbi:anti-adapter protein IraM [Kosakonia sp. H02]|nr:anti-adapter protein IraM [Kosakonia sp. H02]
MEWLVINTIVCPFSGTAFSAVQAVRNLKLIIWYSAEELLDPGDVFHPFSNLLIVNKKPRKIVIYSVQAFNNNRWYQLKNSLGCPKNNDKGNELCKIKSLCRFRLCPYEKEMNIVYH